MSPVLATIVCCRVGTTRVIQLYLTLSMYHLGMLKLCPLVNWASKAYNSYDRKSLHRFIFRRPLFTLSSHFKICNFIGTMFVLDMIPTLWQKLIPILNATVKLTLIIQIQLVCYTREQAIQFVTIYNKTGENSSIKVYRHVELLQSSAQAPALAGLS